MITSHKEMHGQPRAAGLGNLVAELSGGDELHRTAYYNSWIDQQTDLSVYRTSPDRRFCQR